jgi:hypothetical protein
LLLLHNGVSGQKDTLHTSHFLPLGWWLEGHQRHILI